MLKTETRLFLEQSVGADISKLDDDIEKSEPHRALPIRIKSMYNCEEQRVVPMAPPFRGFSALVRFQCRAKLHSVERINMKGERITFELFRT
ncbi:unnamed protein product [Heligmosomoides polygyrus]|uniref:Velvet domain-containing protein n=1 Tax=Heligmosomoides polygyrus TaxID=6339 RepID=A0A183FUN7_HELPZ|nr:unnamed protein product [Heligmosomoides polygyrus]